MNKVLSLIVFYFYFLFLSYITLMFEFDFRKHILKDKYLQNIKFSFKWKEKYAEKKAFEQIKNKYGLDIIEDSEESEN